MDSSSPDSYQHWENHRDNSRSSQHNGMPRLRLFKTRAETKRKHSKDELKHAEIQPQAKPQPGNLHRSMSSPQFQVSKITPVHHTTPVSPVELKRRNRIQANVRSFDVNLKY